MRAFPFGTGSLLVMRRVIFAGILIVLIASACSAAPTGPLPDAPVPTTHDALSESIASGGVPAAVNVWASWCLPCRSEAPLIAAASRAHPDVRFIGLNVRDNDPDARAFIAEFLSDADMEHLSDRQGRIPIDLGGTNGVPLTFFYASDGTIVEVHFGAIDEPTMARFLDEIDR
jgi:thiol-disulfide isomerase/thioredoxin